MAPGDMYDEFLKNPTVALKGRRHYDEMRETLAFMISRGRGRGNSVPTREIVEHLQALDYDISTTTWQIEVLGPLRDAGVYIGSERGKTGMFLIASKADADATRAAQLQRLNVEKGRLKVLEDLMLQHGW
jgi:hypothetical protein